MRTLKTPNKTPTTEHSTPREKQSPSPIMHPLLHTKENIGCEDIIAALEECHARGFLVKALGGCNDIKREVSRCLRAERIERTRLNREDAMANRREMKRLFQEIDQNS